MSHTNYSHNSPFTINPSLWNYDCVTNQEALYEGKLKERITTIHGEQKIFIILIELMCSILKKYILYMITLLMKIKILSLLYTWKLHLAS